VKKFLTMGTNMAPHDNKKTDLAPAK